MRGVRWLVGGTPLALLLAFAPTGPTFAGLEGPAPLVESKSRGGREWSVAALEEHAKQPDHLHRAVAAIGRLDGVYGVLLAHQGELVIERYFREGTRNKPHNLKSASKSVISALVGIAVEEGLLGLEDRIVDVLSSTVALDDLPKRSIRVDHLLGMTSGLAATSYDSYGGWIESSDWVTAALELPMVAEPGTHFQYSTANTHLLSAVLTAATGQSTREYAEEKLFGPMGIEIRGWEQDPKGIYVGGNNLSLTPRDMAKFGQLYLDGGRWGERQLVPRQWVVESTKAGDLGFHEIYGSYGYLWYVDLVYDGAFLAVGYGGQYIYVSPAHEAVVVVTSTLESKGPEWTSELFELIRIGMLAQIEPSVDYYTRLGRTPSDPGLDALEEAIEQASQDVARLKALDSARDLAGFGAATSQARRRTLSQVNLRQGPATSHARLTVLEHGEELEVLQTREGWLRVRARGLEGWVAAEYVGPEAGSWRTEAAALLRRLAVFTRSTPTGVGQSRDQSSAPSERRVARGEIHAVVDPLLLAKEELATAHELLSSSQEELRKTQQASSLLETRLREARSAATAGSESLNEANEARSALEYEVQTARSRIGGLEHLLAVLESSAVDGERLNDQLGIDLQTANEAIHTLEGNLEKYEGALAHLTEEVTELNREWQSRQAEDSPVTVAVESQIVDQGDPPEARSDSQPAPVETASQAGIPGRTPSVRAFCREWAAAWSSQDVDRYLDFYSASFEPSDGLDRELWEQRRRAEISEPRFIQVQIGMVEIDVLAPGRLRAFFPQSFRSSSRTLTGNGVLEITWENDRWKIRRELSSLAPRLKAGRRKR